MIIYFIFGGYSMNSILIVAIILFALSIVLLTGKGSFLVAGYNTMSKKKKSFFDGKVISRSVGVLLLICSLLQFAVYITKTYFEQHMKVIMAVTTTISILLIVAGIIYLNVSKIYKK